ncbi:MAG: single-stranded-DNA-specific exonuclease RecJ [Candidatus Pacebacteria bacterium]|nr:single-stranded-DNA-specific exonuclease RecJ [Candidatus Paceibacterota bacterium]MDR3583549.1 single-stranded-DNA-specific exonuclease RecJ [Candidatus Paceibacterota bacterium]
MNWKIKNENNNPENISVGSPRFDEMSCRVEAGKYHPVILKLLFNRGIAREEEIEKHFRFDYENDLADPLAISGMEKAAARIIRAGEKKEKVAIFGDYDADGVTASAVLFETLVSLGLGEAMCYIPDRQTEGYGLNEKAIKYLYAQGVKLIVTVDCGITNIAEVGKAKNLGMDIIITDHHHAPQDLPAAYAIINPNVSDSGFEFKELAGVGVAFKLATALYRMKAPEKIEQLKWLLDLVAIGTIADCVPLLGENRLLVKYGLVVMAKTRRAGLVELFQVGRINISENKVPDAHKVAFQIAPRINAAGRMDHANTAYKLLIEKKPSVARDLALDLERNNQDRQKVTAEIFREVEILANNSFRDKKFIFAENAHWPVGVLGLVAGKITEAFQKPTVILQRQENVLVGSLRSVPAVNIIENLERCRELLIKFGGHSQAAGVSVTFEKAEKFYEKMDALVAGQLVGHESVSAIEIDAEIAAEDIGWELAGDLKKMEPFGIGNTQPVFLVRNMVVVDAKIVGNGQKHWKISLRGGGNSPKVFDAIGFSLVEKFPDLKKDDRLEVVFNLEEDEWNGNKKLQLKLIDLKLAD